MLSLLPSPCWRQYAVVFILNLSVLTTGMSLAWPSPVLVKLMNATDTPLIRPVTIEEGSWIVSIGFLCSVFTNILTGILLDSVGRKYCVLLTCVPKITVSILFIFVKDVWLMIVGRALIGIADMCLFTVVPVYASEIANKEIRGSIGSFQQTFSSIGIVLTLSVGPLTSYTTYSIVFAGIIILTSVPLLFLPVSPFYLYSKGETDKAMDTLMLLRGSEQYAKEELIVYATSLNNEKVDKMKLIKNRVFRKSLAVSMIFCTASQFIGFNAVSFYLQTILESTNTHVKPEVASAVIGVIQVFASFCTNLITNRFKRKHILITSLVGMLIGMVALGAFFKIKEDTQEVTGFMNYLPLISLILVVYCYSAGTGSLFWVLVPELFDGPARAFAVTLSLIVTIFFMFVTAKYFSILTISIGPANIYWIFSAVCALTCFFIYFCIPETKGKTFSEIQKAIGNNESNDIENYNLKSKI